jgi:hypothetical protein
MSMYLHLALSPLQWNWRGYINQVRLRGLTKNPGFFNLLKAGFVCVLAVAERFQPPGARSECIYTELGIELAPR